MSRTCYVDSGAAAANFDTYRLDPPPPPGTRADVVGVGDDAFFEDVPNDGTIERRASLYVVSGDIIASVDHFALPIGEDPQAGFVTLANKVLAQ